MSSSIGALFDREGLTVKLRLRRRSPPSMAPAPSLFDSLRQPFVKHDGGKFGLN